MLYSEDSLLTGFGSPLGSIDSIRSAGKGFIIHLRAASAAPSYIAPFETTIAFLANYAEANKWPALQDISTAHLEEYLAWFSQRPLGFGEVASISHRTPSSGYLGTQYRRLNRFFSWLEERGHIPLNPMVLVAPPKVAEKVVPLLTNDEFVRILEVTDPMVADTKKGRFLKARNHAVFWMFIDSPARRGEIQGLSTHDINISDSTFKVRGKGNRERIMPLGKAAMKALWNYAAERQKVKPNTDDLWVGCRGEQLKSGGNWLRLMITATGELAKVEGLHAHRFRHTFAINWLRAGEPERILKLLAGWKKIPETYYRTLGLDDVKRGHDNLGIGETIKALMKANNSGNPSQRRGFL